MKSESQFTLQSVPLAPGKEWASRGRFWRVLRLSRGEAYYLGGAGPKALGEGELLVFPPKSAGLVRASQLSDVLVQSFSFVPSEMDGLLTPQEQRSFQQLAFASLPVRFYQRDHPATCLFSEMVAQYGTLGRLVQRAQMLKILGALFDDELARHAALTPVGAPVSMRFRKLMMQLSEVELMQASATDLARRCGCTVRHFSRLFREEFGKPPRARQTELRLRTAGALLKNTEAKIIDVALESGFRNLSRFNSSFKRHYRMTPSDWRHNETPPSKVRTVSAAVLLLLWLSWTAWAAQPRESSTGSAAPVPAETAKSTNAPVTFEVKGYELNGNTLLPASVTSAILDKHTGKAVHLDDIRQALADLQMAYRDRGFISVAVALPPQQLTNGVVQVQITEGRLAEISIQNNRYFSEKNIRRALPSLRTNTVLNGLIFQQELDRANANRDRQIYPVINPGPEPGTSALELKVKDRLPLHGRVELDNYSTPGTPELRQNTAIQYNNLWQLEHQIGVQYSFSPEDYKNGDHPFYDKPLIASYSAFYRMPLGSVNGPPREQPYDIANFGYDEITHRFRPPPPTDTGELIFYASRSAVDTGRKLQSQTLTPPTIPPEGALQVRDQIFGDSATVTENLGARWSVPLPDLGEFRSSLSLGPDFKNYRATSLQDRTFQATVFVPTVGQVGPPFSEFPSPPTSSSRSLSTSVEYLPVTLLWEGGKRDRSGSTSLSLNQSGNYGSLLADPKDFRAIAGSKKANGNYYIVQAGLTREQNIAADWGIRLHADGQWANQPLISNEQFALGGLAGVRGYRDGEEYGDSGWRVQLEPHTPVYTVGVVNQVPITARLYTFLDYGERYLSDPGPRKEHLALLGWGGGLDTTVGSHVDFRLAIGVPALDVPGRPAGDARVNFTIAAQF